MRRLPYLLPLMLLLVGCRSTGPTVNPFMGSTTVPAQPTGAIGPGANAPYYPPNIVPGQPMNAPPAGAFGVPANMGQPQWMPQGTGAVGNPSTSASFAAGSNPNLGAAPSIYDPQVRPASATMPVATSNGLAISNPVSFPVSSESAVRVPSDTAPLVTQRQPATPAVSFAPTAANASLVSSSAPSVYQAQPSHVQTLLPAQASPLPLNAYSPTASPPMSVAPQSMPAAQVYGGAHPWPTSVAQQPAPLQPIPQAYTPAQTTALGGTPTLAGAPTLAYAPTLASSQMNVIRQMPAVEFTDLPPLR